MQIQEIKPLQKAELKLLVEADRICKELGIKYYLIGGTLLGAVRHGGFIPWDVDIDIAMVRDEYEKFCNYCIEKNSDVFFYEDYTTEKNHPERHAIFKLKNTTVQYKLNKNEPLKKQCYGIYLDIFPLDFAPDEEKKQKAQQNAIKFYSMLLEAKACRDYGGGKLRYAVKKVLSVLLKPVSISALQKKVDKKMQQYNNGPCNYIVSMASHYSYQKQLMPFEVYGNPQKIMFEGIEFYAPEKTDEYLKRIYKDYMKLPPEDERYEMVESIEYVDYGIYGDTGDKE